MVEVSGRIVPSGTVDSVALVCGFGIRAADSAPAAGLPTPGNASDEAPATNPVFNKSRREIRFFIDG